MLDSWFLVKFVQSLFWWEREREDVLVGEGGRLMGMVVLNGRVLQVSELWESEKRQQQSKRREIEAQQVEVGEEETH